MNCLPSSDTFHAATSRGSTLFPDARWIRTCGVPVRGSAGEERRVVTVVFADLAGFTALAEGRDPERAKEVLDEIFSLMEESLNYPSVVGPG